MPLCADPCSAACEEHSKGLVCAKPVQPELFRTRCSLELPRFLGAIDLCFLSYEFLLCMACGSCLKHGCITWRLDQRSFVLVLQFTELYQLRVRHLTLPCRVSAFVTVFCMRSEAQASAGMPSDAFVVLCFAAFVAAVLVWLAAQLFPHGKDLVP